MNVSRSLRSKSSLNHSLMAMSKFRQGGDSSEEDNPTERSKAAIGTRTQTGKRQKQTHKPEQNSTSSLAKKARIHTPEPQQNTPSKDPEDLLQIPEPLTKDKIELSFDRPAEPHRTIAPLVTPKGSRLVTRNQHNVGASPSKSGIPKRTISTTNILDEACAHLIEMEPMLQPLIQKHYCRVFCPEGLAEECDPFRSLCSSIMAQQVSGAAASSIKKKFVGLLNGPLDMEKVEENKVFPTPAQVAACDVAFLRQAGLSERKAEYIKGLAEKFTSGELSAAMLINASDEEVLEKLTAVRGLGKWSVEMFACFGLKRMDIFSTGDLGVQRGMAAFMGKDVKKLKVKGGGKWKYMSEQEMSTQAEKFAPFRSVFMWYMWRVEDVDVNVVEEA